MKIGMLTDSLPDMAFEPMLDFSAELGVAQLEFACGNWSSAPHVALDAMLGSAATRREFMAKIADRGLTIAALNCSGNPLHPGSEGARQHDVTLKTFELAKLLGIDRIVMMSGLPGGPGDANPNWIVTDWPPECGAILRYQWQEKLIPYWQDLAKKAPEFGVRKICLELHGHQAVYSPYTLHKLRDAVGDIVGANYDPSHPLWMGADPLAAVNALGSAIYHVHAKDTRIEAGPMSVDGALETRPAINVGERSWNYATLGSGHDASWWRQFCAALRSVGYDDVLSIEHEDTTIDPAEGVRRSVALLNDVLDRRNGAERSAAS